MLQLSSFSILTCALKTFLSCSCYSSLSKLSIISRYIYVFNSLFLSVDITVILYIVTCDIIDANATSQVEWKKAHKAKYGKRENYQKKLPSSYNNNKKQQQQKQQKQQPHNNNIINKPSFITTFAKSLSVVLD